MRRLFFVLLVLAAVTGSVAPALAQDPELPPGGTFADDDGSVHEADIEAIAAAGITAGCDDRFPVFCPVEPVTRGQMAAFLFRSFSIPLSDADAFEDDDGIVFESEINALAASGITNGCNPPANTRYCPDRPVRRGEMAAFLSRVMGLPGLNPEPQTDFDDSTGSVFRLDIGRLAEAGVTKGCNPPENTDFCPNDSVTREQMASFLLRALDLVPIVPPPRPQPELVASFTTHHDCCEARVTNIQLMAREVDGAMVWPGQEFSLNGYLGPRTRSEGYVPAPILLNGEGYCCDHPLNIGGGTSQFGTTFYNAVFRAGYEIVSHRPHSRYIDRYPLGIEATLGYPTPDVVFVNDTIAPIRIDTSYSGTSITVKLYGNTEGREVSWDVSPSGGITYESGGRVTVTRTIEEPDGETDTEHWSWTYQGG
jgi:hypothetical protein